MVVTKHEVSVAHRSLALTTADVGSMTRNLHRFSAVPSLRCPTASVVRQSDPGMSEVAQCHIKKRTKCPNAFRLPCADDHQYQAEDRVPS